MIFIDPNTLNWQPNRAGRVDAAETRGDTLRLSGAVNAALAAKHGLDAVVLLDGADRFMAAAPLTGGKWAVEITPRDIGSDNGFLTLNAWACSHRTRIALPLGVTPDVRANYERFARALLPEESRDLPSIAEDLRALIAKATRVPYVARSIQNNIATGNNYQSLNLGREIKTNPRIADEEHAKRPGLVGNIAARVGRALNIASRHTAAPAASGRKAIERGERLHKGGRPYRESFMNQIDFRGRTVLDIGANTGENSRIARRLGATLVDGYEYDPYFVEIGRLVNAAAGMTRVSLFQGDATRPELFDGMKYDIV
ncbi:MAG: class I SAM-dependent methyltransferase, partial [Alphaproteobacteria bacterium]|nr:class I SAM-dependent methyltransferase [Alphaproteobacteria bacterium]